MFQFIRTFILLWCSVNNGQDVTLKTIKPRNISVLYTQRICVAFVFYGRFEDERRHVMSSVICV